LKPTETVVKGKTMSQCTIDVMSRPVAPGRDVFLHPSEEYGMQEIHGFRGSPKWALPRMVTECHADARPGYNTQKAHEYVDNPSVLAQKVKLLATMIKASSSMLLYTGAGISTSSGIDDYASVGQESLSRQNVSTKPRSPLLAKPTYSHYACTSLYEKGFLKRWLQQNHDGLPQKSGFPQEAMNEIHGAWWDPTNPVVMMSGNLRNDLFEDMLEWENKTDLCLSMGTSMCGMNSDRVFTTCAGKARRGEKNVLGGVIVNLQKTQFDHMSSVRIFARIDDVMKLLLGELNITSPSMTAGYSPIIANETGYEDVFHIAYNEDGHRVYHGQLMTLDLREGARVKLTSGPYAGDEGVVTGKNAAGHYRIRFMHQLKKNKPLRAPFERLLGSWWLQSLTLGKSKEAPIVNI
jgi:NAD-dependent SIR2 family protein deacetylase